MVLCSRSINLKVCRICPAAAASPAHFQNRNANPAWSGDKLIRSGHLSKAEPQGHFICADSVRWQFSPETGDPAAAHGIRFCVYWVEPPRALTEGKRSPPTKMEFSHHGGFSAVQYAVRNDRNWDTLGLSAKGLCASCSKSRRLPFQATVIIVRILRSTALQELP